MFLRCSLLSQNLYILTLAHAFGQFILSHQVVLHLSRLVQAQKRLSNTRNFLNWLLTISGLQLTTVGVFLHHRNRQMFQIKVVLYFFQRTGFRVQHYHELYGSLLPSTMFCSICTRIVDRCPYLPNFSLQGL